jgi:molecular chaperone HtpG
MPPSNPGADLLGQLVHQFSDPLAFYRELIQNSIDAGSTRIEVTLTFQPGPPGSPRGVAVAQVQDWGEGMNRQIIEKYLLTVFRSSKEGDLTKIGKFGIGFLSVFAPGPELVVVDTGRDGEDWRILFRPDLSYELLRGPEPVEGTRVRLHREMGPAEYQSFAARSRAAVARWCRHATAEVTFAAGSAAGLPPPPPESVRAPFVVDAPFQVEYREEGTLIVAGPAYDAPPAAGFYNRGLTLLEVGEELVPGVTFKAASRYLEHTLTRDDVRRDRGFAKVLELVRRLAAGPLVERLRQELPGAAREPARRRDYLALMGYASATKALDADELWFPLADGGATDGATLRKSARRAGWTLFASPGDELAAVLRARGEVVLAEEPRALGIAAEVTALAPLRASASHSLGRPTAAPTPGGTALCQAMAELLAAAGAHATRVYLGTVLGTDNQQLGTLCAAPGEPEPAPRAAVSPFGRRAPEHLCLNEAMPAVQAAVRLAERAPALAAGLCLRALAMRWGALDPARDWRLTAAALRAGGARTA